MTNVMQELNKLLKDMDHQGKQELLERAAEHITKEAKQGTK